MDSCLHSQFAELESLHWWFLGRKSIVSDLLEQCLGAGHPPLRILDVGCGTGSMVEILRPHGEVTGIDPSDEALTLARTGHPGTDFRVGALPWELPRGRFDLITAFDVIEHIDDDRGTVARIGEILEPDGLFVCTVPAYQWMWGPHDDLNHHKRRYSRRQLSAVLQSSGLEVDRISYINFFLFPAVAALRLLRHNGRRQQAPESDLALPGRRTNAILTRLFAGERFLLRRMRLPVGVSLLALARRRYEPAQ